MDGSLAGGGLAHSPAGRQTDWAQGKAEMVTGALFSKECLSGFQLVRKVAFPLVI